MEKNKTEKRKRSARMSERAGGGGVGGSIGRLTGALPSLNSVWTFKIYIFFNLKRGKKQSRTS